MVEIHFEDKFQRFISKVKDNLFKERVSKQVERIIKDPLIGKPMQYNRKGTREVYIKPYRLSYAYIPEEDKIIFLEVYHKDEQ